MHATCAPCPVKDARGYAKASGERYRLTAGNKPCSVKSPCTRFISARLFSAFFRRSSVLRGKSTDAAESPVISTVLLIAVTVALCAAILVFCLGFFGGAFDDEHVPEILKITDVSHYSEGHLTYAGKVSLINAGDAALENKKYGAYLYVNGGDPKAVIETLYAHDFIPTHHRSVKLIGGLGPSGLKWDVGETGYFDFS
ncbi:MAG: type IV pilin, partial [Methanocorpusculum sp.]|nr:type IV pilin [Methanocorpusculum sp.]